MVTRQVDLARWNQETAVNQIDRAMGQVSREVWTVICTPVFLQPPRDKDLGKAVGESELNIRIGLVITQKDVEARLLLLDQIVLESQGLALILDDDVLYVDRLAHQRSGFGILCRSFQQVRTHPRAQALR